MNEENKISIEVDESEYEPTDSEDDYSDGEKELWKELREEIDNRESPSREILPFSESGEDDSEEEDDDQNIADSDIEHPDDDEEDDLPDSKYWGKKGSSYYNTDFQDEDYGGTYNDQQRELADLEAEEAKSIQLRLIKQLKQKDFELDCTKASSTVEKKSQDDLGTGAELGRGLLQVDFSNLTVKEKRALFEKSSPEFAPFVGDLEGYLEELHTLHQPVLKYVREHKQLMIPALEFAQLYHDLALNYCNNLMIYLMLKSKRIEVHNHPVIKRLSQLKKLLNQLEDRHENIIKPQLEALLERVVNGDVFEILPPIVEDDKRKDKHTSLGKSAQESEQTTNDNNSMEGDNVDNEEVDGRRGITYQIAKNKGLTPHRKKEQRNPRVKHRGKYRKALIRRRGAVRTPRTEITRYGGEISGIKSTTSRSVKFKS